MYGELRRVAGPYLGRERVNHTLQPTALVNEAWLRMQKERGLASKGRTQGLALAAQAMRRLLAYLQLNDGAAAAAEFRSILDHRGEVPITLLYPLAYLGHARAAALSKDLESARKSYETFFTLWSGADGDLAPLRDARVEFSRLETAPRATAE